MGSCVQQLLDAQNALTCMYRWSKRNKQLFTLPHCMGIHTVAEKMAAIFSCMTVSPMATTVCHTLLCPLDVCAL